MDFQERERFICSTRSSEVEEPLHASASQAKIWFLLEYNGPWGAKAFEESDLPPEPKEYLASLLDNVPDTRLQFIKSRPGLLARGISFFVALACETKPRLYTFQLEKYADLLNLDLEALVSGEPHYEEQRRHQPLFVVCTNGRRDPCCARYGPPVYLKGLEEAGDEVWQTTHVGGHRFAANLVCFPHALYYGRMRPGEVENVLRSYRQGEIDLSHYRGRACYPEVVQAADYLLRQETGRMGIDDFRLADTFQEGDGRWQVSFRSGEGAQTYRVQVQVEVTDILIQPSCNKPKTEPMIRYHLLSLETGAASS